MAPIVGGPPVGSSNPFTGTGSTLQYLGNGWWGGWSGTITSNNDIASPETMFEFTIPYNKTLIADIVFSYEPGAMSSGKRLEFSILVDGNQVHKFTDYNAADASEGMMGKNPKLPFAAGSTIKIAAGTSQAGDVDSFCTILAYEV